MVKPRVLYGDGPPKKALEETRPKKKAKVKVFRYCPKTDREPRYDLFEVPLIENMSVLGILTYIYENIDSSIAYRVSCRHGRCGACTVIVNGKAALSCRALATENMVIEPIRGFELIRDLVTDPEKRQRVQK